MCFVYKQLADGYNTSKNKRTLDELDSDDEEVLMKDLPGVRTDEEYYKKYRFDLNRNKNLPIYEQREDILTAIRENPVVILKGETGCGKTTQVCNIGTHLSLLSFKLFINYPMNA